MVDFKKLLAESKAKKETNGGVSEPKTITSEQPKFKLNLKPTNSLANKSGVTQPSPPPGTPEVSKPVKFNFSPSTGVKSTESTGVGGNGVDTAANIVSPASENDGSIGEIDVSDFVFKEQPEKYSQEAVDKLNGAISILKESIRNKVLVGQAIQIIMKTLQEHEFLKDIMRANPEHLGLMVKGLRESYGSVIAKKSANKNKKRESDEKVNKTIDLLADIGF